MDEGSRDRVLRIRVLLRVRGSIVGGVLVPLGVLVVGAVSVFGVLAVVANIRYGNPFPVTGGRSGGPIAVVATFLILPIMAVLVLTALTRLMKYFGLLGLLYARSLDDGAVMVGPLLRTLSGRGLVVRTADEFGIRTKKRTMDREPGLWPARWILTAGPNTIVIGAPFPATAKHTNAVKERLRLLLGS